MRNSISATGKWLYLLAPLIFVLSGCSDFAATVRQVTYPPDFTYVSGQQLRSSMERLGFELQNLDVALTSNDFLAPDQQEVIEILRDIENVGSNLQANEAGSSHPFLQNDMSSFVNDVTRARMAASLDPPRYYLAGRVAGSCVNCHRINR